MDESWGANTPDFLPSGWEKPSPVLHLPGRQFAGDHGPHWLPSPHLLPHSCALPAGSSTATESLPLGRLLGEHKPKHMRACTWDIYVVYRCTRVYIHTHTYMWAQACSRAQTHKYSPHVHKCCRPTLTDTYTCKG